VATFCHNVAHDLPIEISDKNREIELVYIDDVISSFLQIIDESSSSTAKNSNVAHGKTNVLSECPAKISYREIQHTSRIKLGDLAALIECFRKSRSSLELPPLSNELNRRLYATYLSYLDGLALSYDLIQRRDRRGVLAEFMKSGDFGQIFVSRTNPGITRGNHYHNTKTEKFFVVEGEAIIRLRSIKNGGIRQPLGESTTSFNHSPIVEYSEKVIEHRVSGTDFRILDIPPGFSHSIENVGSGELVVLFWASEILNPQNPDTYPAQVIENYKNNR
jgi:UDP-2-acetamido-2,6-beta-L-arabino-hexul-4-ose reductase